MNSNFLKKNISRMMIKFKLAKQELARFLEEYRYTHTKIYRDRKSFYSQFIKKNDLVFDVGANVGNRTEIFLSLGARVVAIEPQENCINVLRTKFGNNSMFDLYEGGMDSKRGKNKIRIANADTISSMSTSWIERVKKDVFKDYSWDKEVEINVETLDNLIKERGIPKFIKIDVEGYELEVLKGLSQKTKYLSFEFMLPQFFKEAVDCIDYISTISPIECNISWGESMKLELPSWLNSKDFKEYLSQAKTTSNFGDIYIRFV
jgi:FkbM family methyltransferase